MHVIILLLIIILFFLIFTYYLCRDKFENVKPKCYISLTTIPNRIKEKWTINNIENLINLIPVDFNILINIPYYSLKNIKYEIPNELYNLQKKYKNLIIHRLDKDYGPITKLFGALMYNKIKDDDNIIIIDDDLVYKNIFVKLNNKINAKPNNVISMCSKPIEGFKGFGFKKKTLKGIINIEIPKICTRIDDFIIQKYIRVNKINITVLEYGTNIYLPILQKFCSVKYESSILHPQWEELKWDDRNNLNKKCDKELNI